ncbi:ComF family protein [Mitsuaria sp. GD03876]|uniref:ComF family protein n=1 Tax=Mitsuaria sp. GD03876 TaxID=2975399 RepID=UPI00244D3D56|nr:ComF family protein [Mitsuaria sp. GD03876]MDH0863200.1 ComF family protein [Mitsuaria sp. GD03876]
MLDLWRHRTLTRSSMACGISRLGEAARLARGTIGRWPGQCAFCRSWCRGPLCPACETLHPLDDGPRCALCALRLPAGGLAPRCGRCAAHPPPLSRCVAAMDYAFPWDRLLLALKFGERLELAPLLAARLSHAVARALEDAGNAGDSGNAGHPDEGAPDLIVPVPLSIERLRERGYNQAHEIARRLALPAAERQSRLCAATLLRVRHTGQQAQLPLDERRRNLRGAFAVVKPVRGLRVALVDDVMTSGATLHEAAIALRRAGAADVQAWVAARTP